MHADLESSLIQRNETQRERERERERETTRKPNRDCRSRTEQLSHCVTIVERREAR